MYSKRFFLLICFSFLLLVGGCVRIDSLFFIEDIETIDIEDIYENEVWEDIYEGFYVKDYFNDVGMREVNVSDSYVKMKKLNGVLDEIYDELLSSYSKPINKSNFNSSELDNFFSLKFKDVGEDDGILKEMLNVLSDKRNLLLANLYIKDDDFLNDFIISYDKLDLKFNKYVNTVERSMLLEESDKVNYEIESDRLVLKSIRSVEDGSSSFSNVIEEILNLNREDVLLGYLSDLKVYNNILKDVELESDEMNDILTSNILENDKGIEELANYLDFLSVSDFESARKSLEVIKNLK